MEKNKFYTREKEIDGVKYVAQFNGLSAMLEAVDSSHINDNASNLSNVKIAEYILDKVIVEPKGLTIDDFDDLETFDEVIGFGQDVMQGKFRDKTNEKGTRTKNS